MLRKKLIGRLDKADFPELGLEGIDVKIDTGAYTSSIHCHHIEEILINGKSFVRFELLDPEHPNYHNQHYSTEHYHSKTIVSSNGKKQKRFIIVTLIRLFGEIYESDFSLSNRKTMKYPVLIGRKLLNKNFIVDCTKKYLSFRLKDN